MFYIQTRSEIRFQVNGQTSSCPVCGSIPDAAPGSDTLLRLALPKSWQKTTSALTLQVLLDKNFQIQLQEDERTCQSCEFRLPYFEQLCISTFPNYIIIQLLRMEFWNGKTVKNSIPVYIPDMVVVDKREYEVIGTITHQGTAEAGHNRAYLKQGSTWYLCEDAKQSSKRKPKDNKSEQNYCLLLKKSSTEFQNLRVSQVSSLNSTDPLQSNPSEVCKGCGNSSPNSARLFTHLTKNESCQQNGKYDMEKFKLELHAEKKRKTQEKVRNYRNKLKAEDIVSYNSKRAHEIENWREKQKEDDIVAYNSKQANRKENWRQKRKWENIVAYNSQHANEERTRQKKAKEANTINHNLKEKTRKQAYRLSNFNSAYKRKQVFLASIRNGRIYFCICCHHRLHENQGQMARSARKAVSRFYFEYHWAIPKKNLRSVSDI